MININEVFDTPQGITSFHDVVFEATNIHYPDSELKNIFNSLPMVIIDIARTWGLSDTVFRDEAYDWLQKNKI